MSQCLRWVTDAYNEFLVSGKLSAERVARLQLVYDKLRTSEMADGSSGLQTMSDLTSMIDSSSHPPAGILPLPTPVGSTGALLPEPSPLSGQLQQQRARSHSVERPTPLILTSDNTTNSRVASGLNKSLGAQSHDSPSSVNSVSMCFGSDSGAAIPYSPFDSPFNPSDARPPFAGSRADAGGPSLEYGVRNGGAGCMQEDLIRSPSPFGAPVSGDGRPFGVPASSDGRPVKKIPLLPLPRPPSPVLSPQDILAARISDEIALVEVLVRIQFELASIGDLPAEDSGATAESTTSELQTDPAAATQDATATQKPMEQPARDSVASVQNAAPSVIAIASPDQSSSLPSPGSLHGSFLSQNFPRMPSPSSLQSSFLQDSTGLPALPSPSALQELIGRSTSPPSIQSPTVTTVSAAAVPPGPVGGKVLPSASIGRGRMPYTPPTVSSPIPPATPVQATIEKPGAVIGNSQQQSKTSATATPSSRHNQMLKTSAAPSTKLDATTSSKSDSKTSNEKVGPSLASFSSATTYCLFICAMQSLKLWEMHLVFSMCGDYLGLCLKRNFSLLPTSVKNIMRIPFVDFAAALI